MFWRLLPNLLVFMIFDRPHEAIENPSIYIYLIIHRVWMNV